ncbi:hypothetical protein JKP88DRAFT_313517 [Tribonema minus]|uniref:Cilia- and flagella-associated protein 157 n=1 Tax=Tribonema minus TaxID=303371 RepID=A0A836CFU2_9STRA|nr:hypothetical protein JKP88DRAFT_313517 [Tribonema minus]
MSASKSKKRPKTGQAPEADADQTESQRNEKLYQHVVRCMLASQLETVCARRTQYLARLEELQVKVEEAAQGRSDIVAKLQEKVARNYDDIAVLEAKIEEEHVARQAEERRLQDVIAVIEAARTSERTRCEARRLELEATLTDLKGFLANKSTLESEIETLQRQLDECDSRHAAEKRELQERLEEAAEARRQDTLERISAARQAVVQQLGQQLGAQAMARVQENKRLATELHFQCMEVDRLSSVCSTLVHDNQSALSEMQLLAAEAETLARASTQLQASIRDMHSQLEQLSERPHAQSHAEGTYSACGSVVYGRDVQDSLADNGSAVSALPIGSSAAAAAGAALVEATYQQLALLSRDDRPQALQLLRRLRTADAATVTAEASAADLRANIEAEAQRRERLHHIRSGLMRLARSIAFGAPQSEVQSSWPLRQLVVPTTADADSEHGRSVALSLLEALVKCGNGTTAVNLPAISGSPDFGAQQVCNGAAAELELRRQQTGIPSWDEGLAGAIQQARHQKGSGRSVGTQSLTYRELQEQARDTMPGQRGSHSGDACACCSIRAKQHAAACKAHQRNVAAHAKGGYRGLSMTILTSESAASVRKLMQSPFPPRPGAKARARARNSKSAFVSQRGTSLAGTSIAEQSIGWSLESASIATQKVTLA